MAPDSLAVAPPLSPARISLLTSANVIDGGGDWLRGYTYAPEACATGGRGVVNCSASAAKAAAANPDDLAFEPYFIYAADTCSTWGFKGRDFYGRAESALRANESWLIENELMLDTLGLGNSPIPATSALVGQGGSVTGAAVTPLNALALLESAYGDCTHGSKRMMIHVRPGILALLVATHAVRREGNVWLTPTDNIVVPGRGYPGTGPAGEAVTAAHEWIYATPMVTIRRDVIIFTPPQVPITEDNPYGIPKEAIDRSTNDVLVIAERQVSASYDASCCVFSAQVSKA